MARRPSRPRGGSARKLKIYAFRNFGGALKRYSRLGREIAAMSIAVPVNTHPMSAAQPQSQRPRVRACIDWLLAGTHPEPDEIRKDLLHQRASKTKTLAVAIFASLLTATIAVAMTG